jgi:hypothetical protein
MMEKIISDPKITYLAFSPDGGRIAIGKDHILEIWITGYYARELAIPDIS